MLAGLSGVHNPAPIGSQWEQRQLEALKVRALGGGNASSCNVYAVDRAVASMRGAAEGAQAGGGAQGV